MPVTNIPCLGSVTITGPITVTGTITANQGTPNSTANRWPVQLTDGTDLSQITAAGELMVLATAQPGVDIGDITVNNGAGSAAVNIQDGGNSITVDAESLPLPAGAATLAEQQTQTTSLQLIDNLVATPSTAYSADPGVLVLGSVTGSAPLYTDGEKDTISLTLTGDVRTFDQEAKSQLISVNGSLANIEALAFTINTNVGDIEILATAQAASLSVLDDWDESDRAKVNPIVGQAGVQGNTGVVTANTQRVVLATDVTPPLPSGAATAAHQVTQNTSLQLIDDLVIDQTSSTSGQRGILTMAAVTENEPTYSEGRTEPLSQNLTGNLRVTDQLNLAQSTIIATQVGLVAASVNSNNSTLILSSPIAAQLDDVSTGTVTENNVSTLRMTAARGLHVNPRDNAGTEIFTSTTPGVVEARQATASNLNAQVAGTAAAGGALGNPVTIGGAELIFGTRSTPTIFTTGGVGWQFQLLGDLALNVATLNTDGSFKNTGNVAHDAADTMGPVKIGGKAISLTGEPTAVSAANDRVDAYFDTKGYQHVKQNSHRSTITTLQNAVVFNATLTNSSTAVDLTRFNSASIFLRLTKAGAPTSITLTPEFSPDSGTTWHGWQTASWPKTILAASIPLNHVFSLNAGDGALPSNFRLTAVSIGTDGAGNTITLTSNIEANT